MTSQTQGFVMSRNNHHVARKSRAFLRKKTRPLLATPEQLESRTMMAGDAFKAVNPWDTQFGGAGIYDTGIDISPATSPLVTLPVPGTDELIMLNGTLTNPRFLRYNSDGKDIGFYTNVTGTINGLTPISTGGFILWGSVSLAQSDWIGGPGFKHTYGQGATDGFVAQIDRTGQLLWSTLIGGTGADEVNSAAVVKMGVAREERLVVVGSTTSTSNFVYGGDVVFSGGAGTDGFVMVLGQNGPGELGFRKHLWSSYTSPVAQDPITVDKICKNLGPFNPSGPVSATSILTMEQDSIDYVTILLTGTKYAAVRFEETADIARPFQFTSGLAATPPDPAAPPVVPGAVVPATGIDTVRRGNFLFSMGPLSGGTEPVKSDIPEGVNPSLGESATRNIICKQYILNDTTKIVSIEPKFSVVTKISMRGIYVDPFNLDKTRDFIYMAGTGYSDKLIDLAHAGAKVEVPSKKPWNSKSYQQGYGDPVIAKMDLAGQFKSIQFVSNKRTTVGGTNENFNVNSSSKAFGVAIGVTDLSEKLLLFTDEQSQPDVGFSFTYSIGSKLFTYYASNKVAGMSVENAKNQQTIPDNTSSATTNLGTDFGKVQIGDLNPSQLFTIKSSGESALIMSTPTLPNGFSFVDSSVFSTPIPSGQSRSFEIVLSTLEVGAFNGDFSVANNDPTKSPYNFFLSGEIVTELLPSLQVSNVSTLEGNVGNTPLVFNVILSKSPAQSKPVTIAWTLLPGTATPGTDYIAASGTLQFTSTDSRTKQISVSIRGDRTPENDETFRLVLSSPVNVILDSLQAVGTILTDEALAPLTVGFSPASLRVVEGQAGLTPVSLSVQLSQQSSGIVTVNYSTTNGTAIAGSDYTASSGTIRFMPGETQKIIALSVFGDSTAELNETFNVRLTSAKNTGTEPISIPSAAESAVVTIVNDDGALPLPKLTVSPASVIEGNSGSPKLSFTITLASAISANATLSFRTSDGTAKEGIDYTSRTGTFTILAGRTTAIITVNVIPNRIVDGNRTMTFSVLSNALEVARGTGTIRDDDRASATSQLAIAAAFSTISSQSQSVTKKK